MLKPLATQCWGKDIYIESNYYLTDYLLRTKGKRYLSRYLLETPGGHHRHQEIQLNMTNNGTQQHHGASDGMY